MWEIAGANSDHAEATAIPIDPGRARAIPILLFFASEFGVVDNPHIGVCFEMF
jgi:hypothetical protein